MRHLFHDNLRKKGSYGGRELHWELEYLLAQFEISIRKDIQKMGFWEKLKFLFFNK